MTSHIPPQSHMGFVQGVSPDALHIFIPDQLPVGRKWKMPPEPTKINSGGCWWGFDI